jgi:hypothetical protein
MSSVIAGATAGQLLLEILSSITRIAASPDGLAWIHQRVVGDAEAQTRLDAALAKEKPEPEPPPVKEG